MARIYGITYNSGNTFKAARAGTWYGSADGGNGSGSISSGTTITFRGDYTGTADWYYHPILVRSNSFNGNTDCWTDKTIFPYASVTVSFDNGVGNRTYTWGASSTDNSVLGNFPSTSKTGYEHTGWRISGTDYGKNSNVLGSWVSARNGQTVTATAIWKATSSPITSATGVTLSTSGSVNSTVKWTPNSSSYQYKITASITSAYGTAKSVTMPASGYITPNQTSQYTYSFPFDNSWIRAITKYTQATCTLSLVTYSGSTAIGTETRTITLTLPEVGDIFPTLTGLTATKTSALTNTYFAGKICTTIDKLTVSWTEGTPWNSPIASRTAKLNGINLNPTTNSVVSDVLTQYGDFQTVQVDIVDQRGYGAGAIISDLAVYNYFYPDLNIRFNSDGSLYITGTVASVGGSNTKTLTYSIYEGGGTSPARIPDTSSGTTYNNIAISPTWVSNGETYNGYYSLDYNFDLPQDVKTAIETGTYRFEVKLTDALGANYAAQAVTYSATPVMTFGAGGSGITVHKPAIFEQTIESNGNISGNNFFYLKNNGGNPIYTNCQPPVLSTTTVTSGHKLNNATYSQTLWCLVKQHWFYSDWVVPELWGDIAFNCPLSNTAGSVYYDNVIVALPGSFCNVGSGNPHFLAMAKSNNGIPWASVWKYENGLLYVSICNAKKPSSGTWAHNLTILGVKW